MQTGWTFSVIFHVIHVSHVPNWQPPMNEFDNEFMRHRGFFDRSIVCCPINVGVDEARPTVFV